MKIRVYKVAQEFNVTSKELIDRLAEAGVDVKGHMSTIDDATYALVVECYGQSASQEKPAEKAAAPVKTTQKKAAKKKEKKPEAETEESLVSSVAVLDTVREIEVKCPVTVGELADMLGVRANEIIKTLMQMNILASINQSLERDVLDKLLAVYHVKVKERKKMATSSHEACVETPLPKGKEKKEPRENLLPRAPVITLMGHVDHGKTSLLDAIKSANLTAKEHGGITQHIGAYEVFLNGERDRVVVLDTPGHEAFTRMRARGANITDIVVLVVAADDGVMPQTIEAIHHAQAAKVPIVVAINKIDKPGANPEQVRTELANHDLVSEEWGGKTIFVNVSAITKEGVPDLLEMILLESEMLELKANPEKKARGIVLEGHLSKGRGATATVLVQEGTLCVGDIIILDDVYGRVRAMVTDRGKLLKQAEPSTPVEVSGLSGVPSAGVHFSVTKSEKEARELSAGRAFEKKEIRVQSPEKSASLEELYSEVLRGEMKALNIIIKTDVMGSLEVLNEVLGKLESDKVEVSTIHEGTGGIAESDVMLAAASRAIIIGFHVRPDAKAAELAKREGVEIRTYRVIYELFADIKSAMEGLLGMKEKESELGHAEVRAVFKVSRIGNIAGCLVQKGKIHRNAFVRIVRDGVMVYEGKIASLKRMKDDAKEVVEGYECGIMVEKFNDIKEGDIIEAYEMVEEKQTL